MKLDNLKAKLQEAIDTRESGDLTASRKLFEKLVKEVKKLLKKNSPRDFKYFYVTVMGEYVIQFRLEGGARYSQAIKLGKEIYGYNHLNKLGNILGPRSVSHPMQNIGNFEDAEPYMWELIDMAKSDPYRQGEEMAHLSLCFLRTGRVDMAWDMIEKALKLISSGRGSQKYAMVPHSRAIMIKALILNAKGQVKEALKLAKEALDFSRKANLPFRIVQAENLVEMLSKKA